VVLWFDGIAGREYLYGSGKPLSVEEETRSLFNGSRRYPDAPDGFLDYESTRSRCTVDDLGGLAPKLIVIDWECLLYQEGLKALGSRTAL